MNNQDLAFVFPGQASQYVGMAADFIENFELARDYFKRANDIMEMDLQQVCLHGPEEELKKTFITQPAIFVHSVIAATLLEEHGIQPVAVAGHSLGEYSALVAAGVLDFESGLKLVKQRSRLMFEAGQKRPGSMGAVIGLERDVVLGICESLKDEGIIQPANFNSPGQIALSGEKEVLLKALQLAREKGARKAVELVVSGAFHSPLMQAAEEGLAQALQQTEFADSAIPFYSNVTTESNTSGEAIKELLLHQLTKPVRWEGIIKNMATDGFVHMVEVGPGKVLKGLIKRIDRSVTCELCGTVDQYKAVTGES